MKIQIKQMHDGAVYPKYAHDTDACFDLTAVSVKKTERYIEYDTGIAFNIEDGFVGLLFPRSSVSNKDLSLANSVGVVDSGFLGSVRLRFRYDELGELYDVGDRVGQMMIIPRPKVEFEVVTDFDDTERGCGGFGSTDG